MSFLAKEIKVRYVWRASLTHPPASWRLGPVEPQAYVVAQECRCPSQADADDGPAALLSQVRRKSLRS